MVSMISIFLKGIPLLEWDADEEMTELKAEDIMTTHIVSLYEVDRISKIYMILRVSSHGGFPIISRNGVFKGLILRSQLITLLKEKIFHQANPDNKYRPNIDINIIENLFSKDYPRYPSFRSINITPEDRNKYINLTPYMNIAPYVIHKNAPVVRVFRLYRTMGLRHLPVIDVNGTIVGMITRRDLFGFQTKLIQNKLKQPTNNYDIIDDNIPEDNPYDDVIPDYSSFPKQDSLSYIKEEHNSHILSPLQMNNLEQDTYSPKNTKTYHS